MQRPTCYPLAAMHPVSRMMAWCLGMQRSARWPSAAMHQVSRMTAWWTVQMLRRPPDELMRGVQPCCMRDHSRCRVGRRAGWMKLRALTADAAGNQPEAPPAAIDAAAAAMMVAAATVDAAAAIVAAAAMVAAAAVAHLGPVDETDADSRRQDWDERQQQLLHQWLLRAEMVYHRGHACQVGAVATPETVCEDWRQLAALRPANLHTHT